MSAKNRGGESIAFDSYPSPKPYITAIILRLFPASTAREVTAIFDPFCGAGNVLDVASDLDFKDVLGMELQPELAEQARLKQFPVRVGDSLAPECVWPTVGLTVTNPPYTHAEAAFRKALSAAGTHGTVAFLLRLGFLASAERAPFFEEHGMPDVYVVKRPSFCTTVKCRECGDRYTQAPDLPRPKTCRNSEPTLAMENLLIVTKDGICSARPRDLAISTTDAADYAWMVYGPSTRGRVSRLEV